MGSLMDVTDEHHGEDDRLKRDVPLGGGVLSEVFEEGHQVLYTDFWTRDPVPVGQKGVADRPVPC